MVRQILTRQVEAKDGRWHMVFTMPRLTHKAASLLSDVNSKIVSLRGAVGCRASRPYIQQSIHQTTQGLLILDSSVLIAMTPGDNSPSGRPSDIIE